jgi:hypothetical protein
VLQLLIAQATEEIESAECAKALLLCTYWRGDWIEKIGEQLDVGSGFGLQKDRNTIANRISKTAMGTPQGGVGLGSKGAFADGARNEIEEILGDHYSILPWRHRRMKLKDYFVSLAGGFNITR